MLKRAGNVNLIVSIVAIVVYLSISAFMLGESQKTLRSQKRRSSKDKVKGAIARRDKSAFGPATRAIQRLEIWPMIARPTPGGHAIRLWWLLLAALLAGVSGGSLG